VKMMVEGDMALGEREALGGGSRGQSR